MPLNNIVSAVLQRGGGSVVVSASGIPIITMASNPAAPVLSGPQVALYEQPASTRIAMQLGRVNLLLLNSDASDRASLLAKSGDYTGTLTVSGTGTHTFSGPVQVSGAFNSRIALGSTFQNAYDTGAANARRFSLSLAATTGDTVFSAWSGAAGSETATEALRIVNANGYVSVATRLGVGTAAPSTPLHVVGSSTFTGYAAVNDTPSSGARLRVTATGVADSAALIAQTSTGATVPVVVVKGGPTPGAGGDLQQWQDSNSAVLTQILSNGTIQLNGAAGTGGGNLLWRARAAAPGSAPGASYAQMWYDDTAKAFKYMDSAGTVRTFQAA